MKNIVLVIALVLLSSSGFSQKVNFSGTWNLNTEKSELGDEFSLAPNSIILDHSKKVIDVEKNGEFQGQSYTTNDHFTLDGVECENPGWMGALKTSTATWDKKTKVLKISSTIPMEDGSEVVIIEEYVMNGDNLVIETSAASDYGEMVERFVFDKQ